MANTTYTIQKRRQKMHIKVYAVLCLIVIVVMGFYSYKKWQEYSIFRDAVAQNTELIAALRVNLTEEIAEYDSSKSGFASLSKEITETLSVIFPETDRYTDLTRQIDQFEEDLYSKNNPFEISSIDYDNIEEDENFQYLPFRMSIKSSRENFTDFLKFVETSGSLESGTRLMDVTSIRLNFQEGEEDSDELIINFTVQLNAYFQK